MLYHPVYLGIDLNSNIVNAGEDVFAVSKIFFSN
jgi:hypothetical protein